MSTPISRSASANTINTGHLDDSLFQAKKARSSKGPSSSVQQDNRDAYIINMHTFRMENDSLGREGAEPTCLKHHNWWERNKKWNSTFILSTLATATTVAASLISDITLDGDQALFQRSI